MVSAVVLAGGKGTRVGGDTKKQYIEINGRTVIEWTLHAFEKSVVDDIVLVCPAGDEESLKGLIGKSGIKKCRTVVTGGESRPESVFNGLRALKSDYVLIHDGARPCIEPDVINKAVEYVKKVGACVVGVPVTDTIHLTDENGRIVSTPERSLLWAAQTPQCFKYDLILNAYEKAIAAHDESLTDDAMTFRKYVGKDVYMLTGSRDNIKFTTKEDADRIAAILKKQTTA
ncbi:MAG: 2-C-methyl-D-erythritol 4-phosphate cytidylyltransferase [Lachnospiraceae bacterium]|nr:2-C-methyl-D-erythritol 4-phosphate cytidylyltransferase [Lachnospiraceae bacterium]